VESTPKPQHCELTASAMRARTRLAKRLLRSQRRASPLLGGLAAKWALLARPRRNSARCCAATAAPAALGPAPASAVRCGAGAGALAFLRTRSCSLRSTSMLRARAAHRTSRGARDRLPRLDVPLLRI